MERDKRSALVERIWNFIIFDSSDEVVEATLEDEMKMAIAEWIDQVEEGAMDGLIYALFTTGFQLQQCLWIAECGDGDEVFSPEAVIEVIERVFDRFEGS